jgi:hypothetical protein
VNSTRSDHRNVRTFYHDSRWTSAWIQPAEHYFVRLFCPAIFGFRKLRGLKPGGCEGANQRVGNGSAYFNSLQISTVALLLLSV